MTAPWRLLLLRSAPLLFALTACTRHEAAPAGSSSAAPSASPAPPAIAAGSGSGAARAGSCAGFAADVAVRLARLREGASPDVLRVLDGLPKFLGRCVADAKGSGAWGIRLEELCETKPFPFADTKERPNIIGRWAVVRIEGARMTTYPLVASATEQLLCVPKLNLDHLSHVDILGTPETIAALKYDEPVVFDHDGDGRGELMLHVQSQGASYSERGEFRYFMLDGGLILTADESGKIDEYTRGRFTSSSLSHVPFAGPAEVDSDGRPDGYALYPYGDSHPASWNGPKLFARALPDGSFSVDDPAAVQKTLAQCGAGGDPILVPERGAVDEQASLARAICVGLREGQEAAMAALTRDCGKRGGAAAVCKALRAEVDRFERVVPQLRR